MVDIIVHHLDRSRSTRVLWLLEELRLPYTIELYQRDRNFRAPPELERVHPLGKSPVVTVDGDVLAESGAIIEELVDRFDDGRLRPEAGTPERRQYRYWLHYAEGSLMPPLLVKLITGRIRTAKLPFFIKPVARGIADKTDASFTDPELDKHVAFMEAHLGRHKYFAGSSFSAADIQMVFGVEAGAGRVSQLESAPNLAAWLQRVRGRDCYMRAIERGGPVV